MKRLISILFALATFSHATSVPVALAPVAKQQFFDSSGRVLSSGCIFTYQSGTTTPLASYTDSTGTVQNTNPLILTAGGFAGSTGSTAFFIQAGVSYTIKVVSQGGTNCSLGTVQYTIDGVGGGLTLNTTVATCTGTCPSVISGQTQLFEITLTGNTTANPISAVGITPPATVYWEIIQDSGGSHSWTWPSNSRGGCTVASAANAVTVQAFVWDGTNARATGPCITGNGPVTRTGDIIATGAITASGIVTGSQLASTIASGTPPLIVASTTQVANLNVSQLEGNTWEVPGTIGSTTPNTIKGTTVNGTTSVTANGVTISGVAAATNCLIASSSSAASWATCANGFNGFAISKVTNGYIKLPTELGGLIIEWLLGPLDSGSTEQVDVNTLPLTFPTALLNASVSYFKLVAGSTSDDCWYQINAVSTSTVATMKQNTGNTCQDSKAYVIAIGY